MIRLLLLLVLVTSVLSQAPNDKVEPLRQTAQYRLPVPALRGLWWAASIKSSWVFDAKVGPDHNLYVFEADKNGRWPLVRIQRWWTPSPNFSVIDVPSWSGGDAANLQSLTAQLRFSADGRYVVAISLARWTVPGATPGAKNISSRTADSTIAVVELKSFQTIATQRASTVLQGSVGSAGLINNVVILKSTKAASIDGKEASTRLTALALPTLAVDASCELRHAALPNSVSQSEARLIEEQNDRADAARCPELLAATAESSLPKIEWRASQQGYLPPDALHFSDLSVGIDTSALGSSWLQLRSGDWLVVESEKSILAKFDANGKLLQTRGGDALCDSQQVRGPAWSCSCELPGDTVDGTSVVADCVTEHDTFFEGRDWLNQWITTFDTATLAATGTAQAPHWTTQTSVVIAKVAGSTYVGAISLGERVTIFEVSDGPTKQR